MATAVHTETRVTHAPEGEQRVVLPGVGWDGYETLLAMVGDGHVRLTCDGKDVELMSPSQPHEEYGYLIGRIIEAVSDEFGRDYQALRTTTWPKQAQKHGLEADECFYIANLAAVGNLGRVIDLNIDPPPDLAIEIEISRSALDRLAIYEALGVPEVWRFDGEALTIHALGRDGRYATAAQSLSVPEITPEEVVRWVKLGVEAVGHGGWARRLREWVRAEVVPRGAQ